MVNNIPENWTYSENLEMLFLFYQKTDELLSVLAPTTYAVPMHNTITLFVELAFTNNMLFKNNITSEYYKNYIPPIIDEIIVSLEKDFVLKKMLGKRIDSIKTGLIESINNAALLDRWISLFFLTCNHKEYYVGYKKELIEIVENTKEKNKLLYCATVYFTHLIFYGYSREFLYTETKKFFSNSQNTISSAKQIEDFLNQFDFVEREYNMLILLNMEAIDYMHGLSEKLIKKDRFIRFDVNQKRNELKENALTNNMLLKYDKYTRNVGEHEKLEIVEYTEYSLDPYTLVNNLKNRLNTMMMFKRYFIHFSSAKQVHYVLLRDNNDKYTEIKPQKILKQRPFVAQDLIDSRIKTILYGQHLSEYVLETLLLSIQLHSEALDSKSVSVTFRTLWTALETIFSNHSYNSPKCNVINSSLPIIQKTYLLKILRTIYKQIEDAISTEKLSLLGITDFRSFVLYFSSFLEDSVEMKKLYSMLDNNPLLRSRIYGLRKDLNNGKKIKQYLDIHKTRIEHQLKRLYRIRNIITHLGEETPGIEIAVNHLHAYFDYIVNYILCKSENGCFVSSVSDIVFETQNDIMIHNEVLKKGDLLNKDNFIDLLFGPDENLINFKFEN